MRKGTFFAEHGREHKQWLARDRKAPPGRLLAVFPALAIRKYADLEIARLFSQRCSGFASTRHVYEWQVRHIRHHSRQQSFAEAKGVTKQAPGSP
jgi:hypothetical protein